MRLRPVLLTAAVLAATAVTVPMTASAAGHCASARSTTKLANASGRIFTKPNGPNTRWYACSNRTGRKWFLADAANRGDGVTKVALPRIVRGYAAVAVYDIDSAGEGDWAIRVISLGNGTTRVARSAQGASPAFHEPSEYTVTALVLTPLGWPAWIDDVPGTVDEVQAFDGAGARLLSTGAIDLSTLTASGQSVTWSVQGAAASATLGS